MTQESVMLPFEETHILHRRGSSPGRRVAVFGGVHGNEPCGVTALDDLARTLDILRGEVFFVYANPPAIAAGVRFIERDLNRCFGDAQRAFVQPMLGSQERRRAEELMSVLDRCEALLDIHSTSNAGSAPFVICEPHSLALADQLSGFPILATGWDAVQPGASDYYMNTTQLADNSRGRGICVECGHHQDPQAPALARSALLEFLVATGVIDGPRGQAPADQRVVEVFRSHITETDFELARPFLNFERLRPGDTIGTDGGTAHVVEEDLCILFARDQDEPGKEAYVLGRDRVS